MLQYIFQRFTTYNVIVAAIAICFYNRIASEFLDIVRTTSLCVAAAIIIFYIAYGPIRVFAFMKIMNPEFPKWLLFTYDAVFHLFPAIILGIPKSWPSIIIGLGIIIAWYVVVRNRIQDIYVHDIPVAYYDTVVFLFLPSVCFALLLALMLFHK